MSKDVWELCRDGHEFSFCEIDLANDQWTEWANGHRDRTDAVIREQDERIDALTREKLDLEIQLEQANADYARATERADDLVAQTQDLADQIYVKDKRIAWLEENTERLVDQRDSRADEIEAHYATLNYAAKILTDSQAREINGFLAGFLRASGI